MGDLVKRHSKYRSSGSSSRSAPALASQVFQSRSHAPSGGAAAEASLPFVHDPKLWSRALKDGTIRDLAKDVEQHLKDALQLQPQAVQLTWLLCHFLVVSMRIVRSVSSWQSFVNLHNPYKLFLTTAGVHVHLGNVKTLLFVPVGVWQECRGVTSCEGSRCRRSTRPGLSQPGLLPDECHISGTGQRPTRARAGSSQQHVHTPHKRSTARCGRLCGNAALSRSSVVAYTG